MGSGNTSSMQSSSCGGEDDVDSKAESSAMSMSMSMSTSMPMPLLLDHHTLSLPSYYNLNNAFLPSSLMSEADYLPNAAYYSSHLQPLQNPTLSTNLHLDTFRPNPNYTNRGGLPGSSSSSWQNTSVPHGLGHGPQYQPSSSSAATTTNQPTKAAKNPRKRTRASRRAPTTILTTDTSNFQAMVQEFTGFPAPPFSGSRKLDLFGSGSIFRSNPRGPDPLGNAPSTQKLQQPPLMADAGNANPNTDANAIISNSMLSTITSSIAQMAANTGTAADSNSGTTTASLLNLPKHPSASHQNPTPQPNSNALFTFPSLMHDHDDTLNTPTSGLLLRFRTENVSSSQDHFGAKWDRPQGRADAMDADDGNGRGRWLNNEDYGRVNMNGCSKMNYTAASDSSSSDYHHRHNNDKGLENMTRTSNRAEGTAVENWFGSPD